MSCRFLEVMTTNEESLFVEESVPKNTRYNTKWAKRVFEEWQKNRLDKTACVAVVSDEHDSQQIEDLTVPLAEMSVPSVVHWLSKFVCEVAKVNGERYPSKSLYLIMCGLNRYLADIKGENGFNILDKRDSWFKKFRRALDAEMKDATKCGVGQASKRAAKAEIKEEEEPKLWDMKLLGCYSAESLLNTVYYFNGKLFGLRAGEHRLLRLANILS